MIISYRHNFVVIRVPKSASTTCAVSIYDSGILDRFRDVCASIEDGSKTTPPAEKNEGSHRVPLNAYRNWAFVDPELVPRQPVNPRRINRSQHARHVPFNHLVRLGMIDRTMPCYSVIRHPVDRFISIVYFHAKIMESERSIDTINVNKEWDRFHSGERLWGDYFEFFNKPQSFFLSHEPTCWNIEDLGQHLHNFIKPKGGTLNCFKFKFNTMRPRDSSVMTPDRQQQLISMHEKDFCLWESVFKKYN